MGNHFSILQNINIQLTTKFYNHHIFIFSEHDKLLKELSYDWLITNIEYEFSLRIESSHYFIKNRLN